MLFFKDCFGHADGPRLTVIIELVAGVPRMVASTSTTVSSSLTCQVPLTQLTMLFCLKYHCPWASVMSGSSSISLIILSVNPSEDPHYSLSRFLRRFYRVLSLFSFSSPSRYYLWIISSTNTDSSTICMQMMHSCISLYSKPSLSVHTKISASL